MRKKKLLQLISSKADALLEKAGDENLIHGLLSVLPAGGLLDSVLFRRVQKRARERVAEFSRNIAKELSRLRRDKLDESFLFSDEFDMLIMKVVARTAWEHSEDKRLYFRRFLLNSVQVDMSKSPLKETILELLDSLSPVHVRILQAFLDNEIESDQYYGTVTADRAADAIEGLSALDARATGDDLIRMGLLASKGTGGQTDEHVTGLGQCLITFLREPDWVEGATSEKKSANKGVEPIS